MDMLHSVAVPAVIPIYHFERAYHIYRLGEPTDEQSAKSTFLRILRIDCDSFAIAWIYVEGYAQVQ
jgi:hypothetical protein